MTEVVLYLEPDEQERADAIAVRLVEQLRAEGVGVRTAKVWPAALSSSSSCWGCPLNPEGGKA